MSHELTKGVATGSTLGLIHELDHTYFDLLTPVHELIHGTIGVGPLETTVGLFVLGLALGGGFAYAKDEYL